MYRIKKENNMLKENDRIAWRYKGSKGYRGGFIKEINKQMILIADSRFGIGQWLNRKEIEIEILEDTD